MVAAIRPMENLVAKQQGSHWQTVAQEVPQRAMNANHQLLQIQRGTRCPSSLVKLHVGRSEHELLQQLLAEGINLFWGRRDLKINGCLQVRRQDFNHACWVLDSWT
jgi:hypothetical protein